MATAAFLNLYESIGPAHTRELDLLRNRSPSVIPHPERPSTTPRTEPRRRPRPLNTPARLRYPRPRPSKPSPSPLVSPTAMWPPAHSPLCCPPRTRPSFHPRWASIPPRRALPSLTRPPAQSSTTPPTARAVDFPSRRHGTLRREVDIRVRNMQYFGSDPADRLRWRFRHTRRGRWLSAGCSFWDLKTGRIVTVSTYVPGAPRYRRGLPAPYLPVLLAPPGHL
jgi:hypothetical protein